MSSLKTVIALIVLGVVVVIAFSSMYTVNQTKQALVLQFGRPVGVITEPGLHYKIPLVQDVYYMEKRIIALDAQSEEVIASDQKRLVVDAFARYRIHDPLKYYESVGNENVAKLRLETLINSNLRRVLGSEAFSAVLSGERAALMRRIRDSVNDEAKEFGLDVVDVRIKRADLPAANSDAIYRRMKAERDREAKDFRAQGAEVNQRIVSRANRNRTVLLAEAQKRADILHGDGDARAIQVFAEAYGKDVDFFEFYRTLQAYRTALSNQDTTMVLAPDSEFFKYFDTTGRPK
jgi:modulator of FtsH protease HflC